MMPWQTTCANVMSRPLSDNPERTMDLCDDCGTELEFCGDCDEIYCPECDGDALGEHDH